jgi:hypothetical protein
MLEPEEVAECGIPASDSGNITGAATLLMKVDGSVDSLLNT